MTWQDDRDRRNREETNRYRQQEAYGNARNAARNAERINNEREASAKATQDFVRNVSRPVPSGWSSPTGSSNQGDRSEPSYGSGGIGSHSGGSSPRVRQEMGAGAKWAWAVIALGGLALAIAAHGASSGDYFAYFLMLCAAVFVLYWFKTIMKIFVYGAILGGVTYIVYLFFSHK